MRTTLRVVRTGLLPRVRVRSAADAFRVLAPLARGLDREHFWRLDLDSRGGLLGCELVSVGSLDASIVHPREVFKGALLNNAARVMVAHNHPSLDLRPSGADRQVTKQLVFAGFLLGVELADHLIVAEDRYFSFRKAGLLG
ncbi:MAG: JAB domain-containing protein [Bryobacteraceae bacterium]|nr:JAB domain-containing protein [Bryobacteraceae bacterium]